MQAVSDVVGPFPADSYWEIQLTAPANENIIANKIVPYQSNLIGTVMWNGDVTHVEDIRVFPWLVSGQSGQVRISLVEPGIGVADTGVMAITMDMETGVVEQLKAWLRLQPFATSGTLTTEEHNAVLQTNVGVIAMAGIDPLQLVGGLADALSSSAPLAFGSLGDILGPLTGDGTLAAPPALHLAMGLYWVATTIPDGLGHRHGQSEEYPARLVQWRTTHVVGGIEMATEILDATTHRELWRFKIQTPHAVEYSVLPGVEIFARYWLFP